MSQTDPTAPAFSSHAPNTKVLILDCAIAPAHMAQGSNVTTKVAPSSRHEFWWSAASRSATISAWAVGSWLASRKLFPVPIIAPLLSTTSAPTGTSSVE